LETLQKKLSAEKIKGKVIFPGNSDYEEVRKIWNGMIDKKPAAFVQVTSNDDVVSAIKIARENNLEISIRGAGHNIGGSSLTNGGIVIDFSQMKKVSIDEGNLLARVEPGATLGDFDSAVQKYGLATPTGINSTTGIAGLTLGGGFGWLTRKYGMTVDNLNSVDLVTLEGKKIKANNNENADLFWAIRGGGGNFGVITNFEFNLHKLGKEVIAGLVVYPFEHSKEILKSYMEFTKSAPEELTVWMLIRHAPPLPFLPKEVHGKKVVVLATMYSGNSPEGEKLTKKLTEFGKPYGVHIGAMPYVQWQQAFDPLLAPGARNYWKSHNFEQLTPNLLDVVISFGDILPGPQSEIFIAHIAGAPNKVPAEKMAYCARETRYILNVHARWDNPKEDNQFINWSRELFKATKPFASKGAYVNFMTEEEGNRVSDAYGNNYKRLVEIKRKYDPENLLHLNQNIKP
jgi:FAD/FMN-containing dehydrogenase